MMRSGLPDPRREHLRLTWRVTALENLVKQQGKLIESLQDELRAFKNVAPPPTISPPSVRGIDICAGCGVRECFNVCCHPSNKQREKMSEVK